MKVFSQVHKVLKLKIIHNKMLLEQETMVLELGNSNVSISCYDVENIFKQ